MDADARRELAEEVEESWFTGPRKVEKAFDRDDEAISEFWWQAVAEGAFSPSPSPLKYAVEYPSAADFDAAVGFIEDLVDSEVELEWGNVSGWAYEIADLIIYFADNDPDTIVARWTELPAPVDDLAALQLAERDLLDELPDSALERAVWMWVASEERYNFEFQGLVDAIDEEQWHELCWEAATEPGHPVGDWSNFAYDFEERVESADLQERIALAYNNRSSDYRSVGVELLEDDTAEAAELLDELIGDGTRLEDERHGGLVEVAAALYAEAGLDIPERFDEGFRASLAKSSDKDVDILGRAIGGLDEERARRLLTETFEQSDKPFIRATYVAGPHADASVTEALMAHWEEVDDFNYNAKAVAAGLASFPAEAFGPVVERYSNDLIEPKARVCVLPAGAVGGPAAAEMLVEALGHSSKTIRLDARTGLARLGETARGALEQGADASRKKVRQPAAALLAKLDALRQTPLQALYDEVEALDPSDRSAIDEALDACLAHDSNSVFRSKEHYTEVLAPIVEQFGAAAVVAMREWLLDRAEDYDAAMIWKRGVDLLEERDRAAWAAVDAYEKIGDLPGHTMKHFDTAKGEIPGLSEFGDELAAPVAWALKGPESYRTADLYELLVDRKPSAGIDTLVRGLQSRSKEVRGLCITALGDLGAGIADAVIPALDVSRKASRHAAADVLTQTGVGGQRETVETIIDDLDDDEMIDKLESALEVEPSDDAVDLPEDLAEIRKLARSLIAGGADETEPLYFFEPADEEPVNLNRIGGAPAGVAPEQWPQGQEGAMDFVLMVDLETTPALEERVGGDDARAVALFVENPDMNEAWEPGNEETAVLVVDQSDVDADEQADDLGATPFAGTIAEEPVGFEVVELEVPSAIFASETSGLAGKLRSKVHAHSARAMGEPTWVQQRMPTGDLWWQFDEFFAPVNLGDRGVMYVFPDTAFWQCH